MITALHSQPLNLPLWPGEIPNYKVSGETEKVDTNGVIRVSYVQQPGIEVFLPSKKNATGQAVVICPGGGYWILAYDLEGTDIAGWLNSIGVAAIVLKYRLPVAKSNVVRHESPLMDAQRAIRLTRHHAEKWNIDPAKIGIMGFSAGGHLASTASTRYVKENPGADDPVQRHSSRPDFSILVYPVITFSGEYAHTGSRDALLGKGAGEELVNYFSNQKHVDSLTPPAFLVHASDDKGVPVENSILYYKALIHKNVPASLHVYPEGGHGFGLGVGKGLVSAWPGQCEQWLRWLDK
jgi:acetyl esterase/lipase